MRSRSRPAAKWYDTACASAEQSRSCALTQRLVKSRALQPHVPAVAMARFDRSPMAVAQSEFATAHRPVQVPGNPRQRLWHEPMPRPDRCICMASARARLFPLRRRGGFRSLLAPPVRQELEDPHFGHTRTERLPCADQRGPCPVRGPTNAPGGVRPACLPRREPLDSSPTTSKSGIERFTSSSGGT